MRHSPNSNPGTLRSVIPLSYFQVYRCFGRDIEGTEYKLLVHLILAQAVCLINHIDLEWHHHYFRQAVKHKRSSAVASDGSNGLPSEASGVSAILALISTSRSKEALFPPGFPPFIERVLGGGKPYSADCLTRLKKLDDETYPTDMSEAKAPWPASGLCRNSNATRKTIIRC